METTKNSKIKWIIPLILLLLLLVPSLVYSQEKTDLVFFYGKGCPHCEQLESFLNQIKDKYTGLNIISYEVYFNEENRQLFGEMTRVYNTEIQGVPTLFINDKVLVGFSNLIAVSIEQEIEKCTTQTCISPLEKLKSGSEVSDSTLKIIEKNNQNKDAEKTELTKKLTIPAVISAAAVDAINPCEFAILIILLTTILASGGKRKALYAGLAFALSIYISYFLMGLGLYSVIQISGLTRIFYTIVAILAIIIGLFNLKDYLWYGKWFTMEVPIRWRPKMKSIVKKVTSVPGAFFAGFIISLFLLPCTSGPYIAILGLLLKTATKNYAILLLLLYNLVFILPMLLITIAISFGFTTTEKAELWRTRKLRVLHLITGIIILLLGIGMFIAMGLKII